MTDLLNRVDKAHASTAEIIGPFAQPKDNTKHYVRCRVGRRWEVRGPNQYQSNRFDTQQDALNLALTLNIKV